MRPGRSRCIGDPCYAVDDPGWVDDLPIPRDRQGPVVPGSFGEQMCMYSASMLVGWEASASQDWHGHSAAARSRCGLLASLLA